MTSEITFKVNVMGTSQPPTARVIIETDPQLSFPAQQQGENWTAKVTVPHSVMPGTYPMRVEVLLNNRLFTPFSKPVNISSAVSQVPETDVEPVEAVMPFEPATIEQPRAIGETSQVSAPLKKISIDADIFKINLQDPAPKKVAVIKSQSLLKSFQPISIEPGTIGEKKKQDVRALPLIEIKHELPITLEKGEIIYQ